MSQVVGIGIWILLYETHVLHSHQLIGEFGLISVENASLEDLVWSHFTLQIDILPPYNTCLILDEKEWWTVGEPGIDIGRKKNDIHRGCSENGNARESGRGNL